MSRWEEAKKKALQERAQRTGVKGPARSANEVAQVTARNVEDAASYGGDDGSGKSRWELAKEKALQEREKGRTEASAPTGATSAVPSFGDLKRTLTYASPSRARELLEQYRPHLSQEQYAELSKASGAFVKSAASVPTQRDYYAATPASEQLLTLQNLRNAQAITAEREYGAVKQAQGEMRDLIVKQPDASDRFARRGSDGTYADTVLAMHTNKAYQPKNTSYEQREDAKAKVEKAVAEYLPTAKSFEEYDAAYQKEVASYQTLQDQAKKLDFHTKRIDDAISHGDWARARSYLSALVQAELSAEDRTKAAAYIDKVTDSDYLSANRVDTASEAAQAAKDEILILADRGQWEQLFTLMRSEKGQEYKELLWQHYGIDADSEEAKKDNYFGLATMLQYGDLYEFDTLANSGEDYKTQLASNTFLERARGEMERAQQSATHSVQMDSYVRSQTAYYALESLAGWLGVHDTGIPYRIGASEQYLIDLLKENGVDLSGMTEENHREMIRNALQEQSKKASLMRGLLQQQGFDTDTVYEYLKLSVQTDFEKFKQESFADWSAKTGTGEKMLTDLLMIPYRTAIEPFTSGAKMLTLKGVGSDTDDPNSYVPMLMAQSGSDMVRAAATEAIEKSTDWELFGKNVASFLYSAGMSAADSAANALSYGHMSVFAMGTRAAGAEAADIIARGGSREQAFTGGLAAGTIEAVTEFVSIDKLLKSTGSVDTLRAFLKSTASQAFTEATEEMSSEVLNIIVDSANMGNLSRNSQAIQAYMNEGMSYEEASKQVLYDNIGQVVEAGAQGFVSGGMGGGVKVGAAYVSNQVALNRMGEWLKADSMSMEDMRAFVDTGLESAQDTKSYELAVQMQKKLDAGKKLSKRELARLYQANVNAINAEKTGAKAIAEHNGISESVDEGNSSVRDPLMALALKIARQQNGLGAAPMQAGLEESSKRVAQMQRQEQSASGSKLKTVIQGGMEVSEDGTAKVNDAPVTVKGISRIERGEGRNVPYLTVVDSQGNESVVASHEVTYASREEGILYESFAQFDVDPMHFHDYMEDFKLQKSMNQMSAEEYALLYDEGVFYGRINAEQDLARIPLNEAARRAAFAAGRDAENLIAKQAQAERDRAVAERKESGKGKLRERGKLHGLETLPKKRNALQNAGIGYAKRLAEMGFEVHIYQSRQNAKGEWVDENGEIADNGYYLAEDGSIHIDLNAGEHGQGIMVYTLAHELTHALERNAPQQYKLFAELLVKWYGEKGVSVSALVKARMAEQNISRKEAFHEVVARSCESFLTDSDIMHRITELKAKSARLCASIRKTVLKFLNWARSLYKDIDPESEEGMLLHDARGTVDRLYDAFYNALQETVETIQWVGARKNTADEGDVKYSIRVGLKADLEKVKNRTFPSAQGEVEIGNTSDFMVNELDADPLIVTMPATKAYRAIVTEEQAIKDGQPVGEDINYHGLGVDGLYNILERSEHPIAAFVSKPSEKGSQFDRIVLVTDVKIGEDLGVAVVEVDTMARVRGRQVSANKTITAYDKDSTLNAVQEAFDNGRLLYIDKKSGQQFNSGRKGSDCPTTISESVRKKNIQDFWANVKWKKTGADEMSFGDADSHPTAFAEALQKAQQKKSSGKQRSARSQGIDTAYLAAVKSGDMETVQRMVDEAAKKAFPNSKIRDENGSLIPVYHGTKDMFYVFDTSVKGGVNGTAEGFGIYTSDNPEVTAAYGERQIKMYANITKPARSDRKTITPRELAALIKNTCEKQAQKSVEDGEYDSVRDALYDTWVSNYVYTYDVGMERAYRETANNILQMNDNDMDIIQEVMTGMAIRNYAEADNFYRDSLIPITGFDGFIAQWENRSTGIKSNIILALNSNQLKSADPVTYDDDGNVIPLSERFDEKKTDIRHSKRGGTSERDLLSMSHAELRRRVAEVEAQLAQAQERNKTLTAQKEHAKAQLHRTDGTKVDPTGVFGFVRKLMKRYENPSLGNELVRQKAEELLKIFNKAAEINDALDFDSAAVYLYYACNEFSSDIVAEGLTYADGSKENTLWEMYPELRKMLRETKLLLPKSLAHDVSQDFADWRKRYMGRLDVKLVEDGQGNIDSFYHDEIMPQFSELFDGEIYSEADMLLRIAEVSDRIYESRNADVPYSRAFGPEIREGMVEDIANDILNEFARVNQNPRVKAAMDKLIERHEKEIQRQKAAHEAYRKEAKAKQEKLIAEYQKARAKSVESRKKTAVKGQIRRRIHELNSLYAHGNKKRNVKEGMRDTAASLLASADVLFSADAQIPAQELARNGVQTELTEKERIAMDQYIDILGRKEDVSKKLEALGNSGKADAETLKGYEKILAYGDRKLAELEKKLAPVFERERARVSKATFEGVLGELAASYKRLESAEEDYIKRAFEPYVYERLTALQGAVGGTPIKDMSLAQLTELYDAVNMVVTTIKNANKLFVKGKTEDIREYSRGVVDEIKQVVPNVKDDRIKALNPLRSFAWDELKPVYAFRYIGSEKLERLYWDAVTAEGVYARDIEEAKNFISEQRKKYGYTEWDRSTRKDFDMEDGRVFTLDVEQMMSIYAYSRREQAFDHMMKGGFVFNPRDSYKDKKLDFAKVINQSEPFRVDLPMLSRIIEALTPEQRAYAETMQAYLSQMGEKGNEVSRQMYGIDLFKEKFYFPLQSSHDFLNTAQTELQKTQTTASLKNTGMAKETVPHASNPIILSRFDDVWMEHVNKMSSYHAFVIPIDNLSKVLNFTDGKENLSMMMTLRSAFGDASAEYLKTYIQDLNGGTLGGRPSGMMSLFGKFKKTAVGASLSTAIQQPTAILRAMAYIRPDYFVPFLRGSMAKTTELTKLYGELRQYAPIAIIKEMGGFDVGSGRQTKDYMGVAEYEGFGGKVKGYFSDKAYRSKTTDDAFMYLASKGDVLGWTAIWSAVKKEVASQGGRAEGTEAYLKRCGERFTEIIVLTQVYDSVNSRSGIMRSKNELNKFATSFMGEPTTSLNMCIDAIVQAKRGKGKANAVRKIAAVVISTVAAGAAASVIYANRDDEDDEAWTEKWAEQFGAKLCSDLNPLNMVPYLRDVVSLLDGWDVERPDMAIVSDLISAFDKLDSDKATTWQKIESFTGSFAAAFGVPLKNLLKDARGIYNAYEALTDEVKPHDVGGAIWRGFTGDELTKSEKLYDALIRNDKGRLAVMKKGYKDESAYVSAVRAALREHDPRVHEGALSRLDGDITGYTRVVMKIVGEGHFSQEDAVAAIESEMRSITTEDTESSPRMPSLYNAGDYMSAALDEPETAEEVKSYILQRHIDKGKTKAEAESEFYSDICSEIGDMYKHDGLSYASTLKYLTEYGGKSENEAYWQVDKWNYAIENGSTDGYAKYGDFYTAVQTGKNLQKTIQLYVSKGAKKETLISQITSHFKPIYISMSKQERAKLKNYLLNAYANLGEDRVERAKLIDRWLSADD